MQPLENYIKHADELAQEVVNAWGGHVSAGNAARLTAEFKVLFDAACEYRNAKQLADNRREFNMLSEQEAAKEKATREAFAKAYMEFREKHQV